MSSHRTSLIMNKLYVKVLLQANQNKILRCHNYTSIGNQFTTANPTKNLYPSLKNMKSFYFDKQCKIKSSNFLNVKRTLAHDITSIGDEEDANINDIDIDDPMIPSNRIRGALYPDSNDPVINKLKLCKTVQEVFDIIIENEQYFNHEQCSQTILVLWDLQKIFEYANSVGDTLHEQINSKKTELLENYKINLNQHPTFNLLLALTLLTYKQMSTDALSCSYLYLRRMGVSTTSCLMQNLIIHLEHLLVTVEPPQFPLTALSRFAVGILYDKDLRSSISLVKILPHVIYFLDRVDNIIDLRTLTISLRSVIHLLDKEILKKYKMTLDELINQGKLSLEDTSTVFKSLVFLDQSLWAQENITTVRKLLLLFCGATSHMFDAQISLLQKVLNHHLEPYSLMVELEANSGQSIAEYKIGSFYPNESFLTSVTSGKQQRGMIVAREIINSASSIIPLIEILPFISTNDMETCNKYWMRVLEFLESPVSGCSDKQLFQISLRYMQFSSNMSWYRNIPFEQQVVQVLTTKLVEGGAFHITYKFAYIAAFLLAYDRPTSPDMPKHIVSKLLEIMHQFTISDCEQISKGLSVAMDIRRRRNITQEFLQQFVSLDAALNSQAMSFLNRGELSVHMLNKIMRAYIHRKGTIDTELFQQLVKKYEAIEECDLSSRRIREIVYNLVATHCLIPTIFDKMVSYCNKQREHIIGDTACKLIYACYHLGYIPPHGQEFFSIASQLITRDKEKLTGLGILQGCLALSYFSHLPSSLVQFIFTVDFLEHLDEEIKHCFAKATYPVRIRRCLMELNRAVCLDQPEAGVPWFHAKYCEDQHALGLQEHYYHSPFLIDVHHTLVMATGNKECVQMNVSSPYGYNIDLQVCLDHAQKPVDVRQSTDTSSLVKVAVLLQKYDNFTTNTNQLKGYYQMKQRHLEMMGYRVISINDAMWNAMYMAEPKAKFNHIKKLIWPSES